MEYYDSKNWVKDKNILSPDVLNVIEQYLTSRGYLYGIHANFCGARGATPLAYDDFVKFKEYLTNEVNP